MVPKSRFWTLRYSNCFYHCYGKFCIFLFLKLLLALWVKISKLILYEVNTYLLEFVQDFLIKLDIKPLVHLLEMSIFSLNDDLVRLTKIMNNLVKDLKILSFKVIFKCLKLVESFQKNISVNEIFWKLWFFKCFI